MHLSEPLIDTTKWGYNLEDFFKGELHDGKRLLKIEENDAVLPFGSEIGRKGYTS